MVAETKRQQRRGIRFPTHPLPESVRVAKVVQDQGGGRLSGNGTAAALGLSPSSSSFITRIASARHFGLVEDDDEGLLRITSLGKKILRPTTPGQVKGGLSQALRNFSVFNQLLDRFQNTQLPDRAMLENILALEYGISDGSKGTAYDVFVESGKLAQLIVEKGKELYCQAEGTQPQEESEAAKVPAFRTDQRLVQLLLDIGALRAALELYSKSPRGELSSLIKTLSQEKIERTAALAAELGLPATRMSIKILSDRARFTGFEEMTPFVQYIEEGLYADLELKETTKLA